MKKTEHIFTWLTLPIDAVMVFAAFLIAYLARAKAIALPVVYIWPFNQYIRFALVMVPIWLIAFSFAGLYGEKRKGIKEFGQIIVGASLGAMSVVLWVFLNRSDFFSRLIVFYIWILAIISVALGRSILNLIKSNLYLFGMKRKNLVIIGKIDETALHLISQVTNTPSLGYKLYGIISKEKPRGLSFKYLGKPSEADKIINPKRIDEVLLTDTRIDNKDLFRYMRLCQEKDIIFKAVPAHAYVGARTLQFDAFAGIPIIEFKGTVLESWGAVFKRIMDLIGSVLALIIFSPLMFIIALAVRIDSRGPIIYRNLRVGRKGNFETLKFRTMKIDYCTGTQYGGSRAEQFENRLIKRKNIKSGSAVYKIADDPRVTRVGQFLRRTSLDELPQFFNVLKGNMSLVGPRPHQPKEVKRYSEEQRKLLLIKPGVTGLAQISGRSDLTFEEEARLDIFYLENWSIPLDFYIIARTFGVVIWGKGSY